ncbi:unnamed protein product [Phytophthora fragariaefolia]|uniref:Unnamed protein product n=1 Tax=Phytophthora fragariaefolia TaxID=1490495 RepID=A0A9W6TV44_9STRA|nr:unnamed protein product [Phytophthora fragariaefolia]
MSSSKFESTLTPYGETQAVVHNALNAADASLSVDEIADDVARAAVLVSALPNEMSSKAQAAESRRTSPGTSFAAARGRKLKQNAATPLPAPAHKRFRRPLRILDDDSEFESDSSVLESHPDPNKSVDANVAVPAAPASSTASTSHPLQCSKVPSSASSSDLRDCKPSPLRSQSAPEFRSKASSRGASRISSPIRARSTSSSTASGALGSGGASPTLLVSTLQDVHSSLTSHPPRSLPALSSDESLTTLVFSDVDIVGVSPAAVEMIHLAALPVILTGNASVQFFAPRLIAWSFVLTSCWRLSKLMTTMCWV